MLPWPRFSVLQLPCLAWRLPYFHAVSVSTRRGGRSFEYRCAADPVGARVSPPFSSPRAASQEWALLKRDPWLVSQTLMQILYLLPPALLLWVTFRTGHDAFIVLIPVIVMAAGPLAGGLAWLTISGEDAPDLVSTAPIAANRILLAKIEAVIGMVALFAPIVARSWHSMPCSRPRSGTGILSAAAAAMISCFRVQARRIISGAGTSRGSRLLRAFSSIAWAGDVGAAHWVVAGDRPAMSHSVSWPCLDAQPSRSWLA
jgi:ABC-2 type transport system permease protein